MIRIQANLALWPRLTHRVRIEMTAMRHMEEPVQVIMETKEQTMLKHQEALRSSLQSLANSVINLGFQQYPVLRLTVAAHLAWWQVLLRTVGGEQPKKVAGLKS